MPSRGGPGPASAGGTAQGTGRRRRSHAPCQGLEAELPLLLLHRHGARARQALPYFPLPAGAGPSAGLLLPGPPEQVRPVQRAQRDHAPADHQQSRLVRVLAPAAACGPPDRPAPGLLRSSCGDPRRSDLVVLLGRAQGILPALEGYRPSLPHREHALCPQAQAQFR